MSYKIILTGATGMVGEGVLLECLEHPQIAAVLSVSRRSCGRTHPKLKEYIVPDFLSLKEDDEQLKGYDACFFCAGVTSIGKKEAEYTLLTYDTTLHFATVLVHQNPGMIFNYISGAGTDSSEKGKLMWARVKGKTENELQKLSFRKVHHFRPAVMKIREGQRNALPAYKYFAWMFPILKILWPGRVSTLKQVGRAMIHTLSIGTDKQILEVPDINALGDRDS